MKLRFASPPGFPFVQFRSFPLLSVLPEGSLPLEMCFAGGQGKVLEQRMLLIHSVVQLLFLC